MERSEEAGITRAIGIVLIVFAIAFNIPYILLALNFDYPGILRSLPGIILARFDAGGAGLIYTWAAFMVAALLLAPVSVAVACVTRRRDDVSSAVAALGIAAAVTQAMGLSRWVYAVPHLAGHWVNGDYVARDTAQTAFMALHQFGGVGTGEAIGQTLTAFWVIGVAIGQLSHPRFGSRVATLGLIAGGVLLLGLVEGLSTVLNFEPGPLSLAAMVGFILLALWLTWTGLLCILRPHADA